MLFCFYWLFGYIKIEIIGEGERLLNLAAREHIKFWDLHFKSGKIIGNISVRDFKRLFVVRKNVKARLHILKRHGLPFITHRYKNRLGFYAGFLIYCSILYFMSLFIWVINVEGNEKIKAPQIIRAVNSIGITEGSFKAKINPTVDAQRLLLKEKSLAWASLNIEGSVLNVNVSESKSAEPQEKLPCNLVALQDGVIKKIDLTEGYAVVKVGDVVRKGDLLVSGIIEGMFSTQFVTSAGTITAETVRVIEMEEPFEKTVNIETGKIKKRSVLSVFGINIPMYIGTLHGEYNIENKINQVYLFGKKLPIRVTTNICRKTKEILQVNDKNKTQEILLEKMEKDLAIQGVKDYEIKDIKVQENANSLKIYATVICNENIALPENIIFEIKN